MQTVSNGDIVSNGDNLHEMSNSVFWQENKKKYFKMSSAVLNVNKLYKIPIIVCFFFCFVFFIVLRFYSTVNALKTCQASQFT